MLKFIYGILFAPSQPNKIEQEIRELKILTTLKKCDIEHNKQKLALLKA